MSITKLTESDFNKVVNSCMKRVNLKKVAWSIPQTEIDLVMPLLTVWNTKYGVAQNKKLANAADREGKVQARKKLSPVFSNFVEVNIYRNRKMDDADITSCNLSPRKKTRTKPGKPKTTPQMAYEMADAHHLLAHYKQAPGQDGTSKRGRPEGVGRVEITYVVSKLRPNPLGEGSENPLQANPDDFPKLISGTKSPVAIPFSPADEGKYAMLASRWVSTNNISGDWGKVEWMMIP